MLKKVVFFAALLLILSPMNLVFAATGVERADLRNARLVNSFGDTLSQNINTYQQVQISADITNKQVAATSFVYIVEVMDRNSITQKLTWISGNINPQQTFSPAISWFADMPGSYTARIYVWDSIPNADALSRPLEIKFIVS